MNSSLNRANVDLFLDHLTVERGLSRNTLLAYQRDLLRYIDFLESLGKSMLDVSERDIEDFLSHLRNGDVDHPPLSPSSSARSIIAVRGFHKFLARENRSVDPAAQIHPPTPGRRLPKALSLNEIEGIISGAGSGESAQSLRDRALVELLYATGARVSEVISLDVDQIKSPLQSIRLVGDRKSVV